jgi:hypothetical protein
MNVDCMLVSVMVEDAVRPVIAQAYAALHCYWVGYSCAAQHSRTVQAGTIALRHARPWRRAARAGIYDAHTVHGDPRSDDRASF